MTEGCKHVRHDYQYMFRCDRCGIVLSPSIPAGSLFFVGAKPDVVGDYLERQRKERLS